MQKNISSANFIKKIKNIDIQGATEIAISSLLYLKNFAKKYGFSSRFENECKKLLEARPTAVPLFNALKELKKQKSAEKINILVNEFKNSRKKIAENSSGIFKKKSVIITHCHSHEVIAVLIKNKKRIKKVFVTETRPKMQGLKTAKDLTKAGMDFKFIIDSAAGFYMKEADMVVVGSDALRRKGFINKIGTLPIALTAYEFNKPLYVIANTFKIDKRKKLVIEFRSGNEVNKKLSKKVLNPAFDITGFKYVTSVVTEKGIFKPREILRMIM